jgi:hypothetical protein
MSVMTQSELKQVLSYDQETGVFTWLVRTSSRSNVGEMAGGLDAKGYIVICIKYKRYLAHRLIWFYMTGKFPENQIDHIDGNKANNRFSNLRDVTNQQNHFNTKAKGSSFDKAKGKYSAKIMINGKSIHLGYYKTAIEARSIYATAKLDLHGKEFSGRLANVNV